MRCQEADEDRHYLFFAGREHLRLRDKMNRDNVGFVPICEKDHSGGHRLIGTLTTATIVLRVVAVPRRQGPARRQVRRGDVEEPHLLQADRRHLARRRADGEQSHLAHLHVRSDILKGVISLSDIRTGRARRGAETLRKVSERERPRSLAILPDDELAFAFLRLK